MKNILKNLVERKMENGIFFDFYRLINIIQYSEKKIDMENPGENGLNN